MEDTLIFCRNCNNIINLKYEHDYISVGGEIYCSFGCVDIEDSRIEELKEKVEELKEDICDIEEDKDDKIFELENTIDELEGDINKLEEEICDIKEERQDLEDRVLELTNKIEDMLESSSNSLYKTKGILVNIEGIDGSGKGTQASSIVDYINTFGGKAVKFSFPMYNESFISKLISKYLNNEYGSLHPEIASLLYSIDRFESKEKIEDYINKGYVVVCDRYVNSNIAHQCSRLDNSSEEKIKELKDHIENLEYNIFKVPKPDIVFLLDLPVAVSSELILKKGERTYTSKKKDLHEQDDNHLKKSKLIYDTLAKNNNWKVISCVDEHNQIIPVDKITIMLHHYISNVILEKVEVNNGSRIL